MQVTKNGNWLFTSSSAGKWTNKLGYPHSTVFLPLSNERKLTTEANSTVTDFQNQPPSEGSRTYLPQFPLIWHCGKDTALRTEDESATAKGWGCGNAQTTQGEGEQGGVGQDSILAAALVTYLCAFVKMQNYTSKRVTLTAHKFLKSTFQELWVKCEYGLYFQC